MSRCKLKVRLKIFVRDCHEMLYWQHKYRSIFADTYIVIVLNNIKSVATELLYKIFLRLRFQKDF